MYLALTVLEDVYMPCFSHLTVFCQSKASPMAINLKDAGQYTIKDAGQYTITDAGQCI